MGQAQLFSEQIQRLGGLCQLGLGLRQVQVYPAQGLDVALAGAEAGTSIGLPTRCRQKLLAQGIQTGTGFCGDLQDVGIAGGAIRYSGLRIVFVKKGGEGMCVLMGFWVINYMHYSWLPPTLFRYYICLQESVCSL